MQARCIGLTYGIEKITHANLDGSNSEDLLIDICLSQMDLRGMCTLARCTGQTPPEAEFSEAHLMAKM